MFRLKERPYPAHVLISFWFDSDNKHFDFFYVFRILADISVLFILAMIKIWKSGNMAIHPCSDYF